VFFLRILGIRSYTFSLFFEYAGTQSVSPTARNKQYLGIPQLLFNRDQKNFCSQITILEGFERTKNPFHATSL